MHLELASYFRGNAARSQEFSLFSSMNKALAYVPHLSWHPFHGTSLQGTPSQHPLPLHNIPTEWHPPVRTLPSPWTEPPHTTPNP